MSILCSDGCTNITSPEQNGLQASLFLSLIPPYCSHCPSKHCNFPDVNLINASFASGFMAHLLSFCEDLRSLQTPRGRVDFRKVDYLDFKIVMGIVRGKCL